MVDMVLLLHGNAQPLSRIQPQLTAFFTQHYLQGRPPTDANINVSAPGGGPRGERGSGEGGSGDEGCGGGSGMSDGHVHTEGGVLTAATPDMMLFGLLLQTAAEELINGLEEYIVESFVRLILHTHQPVYSSLITTINQPWLAGPGDGLWVLSVHIPTIKLLRITR